MSIQTDFDPLTSFRALLPFRGPLIHLILSFSVGHHEGLHASMGCFTVGRGRWLRGGEIRGWTLKINGDNTN